MTIPLRLQCPKCAHVERMAVHAPLKMWERDTYRRYRPTTSSSAADLAAGAAVCPNCSTPFGLTFTPTSSSQIAALLKCETPDQADASFDRSEITTYPRQPTQFIKDESLPTKIREAFVFLQEDALRKRNGPGLMSGARTCLDVALKELGEATGGRRERINNLAARGVITLAIAEWAQTLWAEGSDAVHDLEADIAKALEHVEFLKLFFEVAFGLPARVKKASSTATENTTAV